MYLRAEWCVTCLELEQARYEPPLRDALAGAHVIEIDIVKADRDSLERAGFRPVTLPAFYKLDAYGELTGDAITGDSFGAATPENIAAALTKFLAR